MEKLKIGNIWVQVLLWSVLYSLIFLTLSSNSDLSQAFLRTSILVVAHGIVFYTNLHVFLPKLFHRKKYVLYFLVVLLLIALLTWLLFYSTSFPPIDQRLESIDFFARRKRNVPFNGRMIQQGITLFGTLFLSTILRNATERQKKDRQTLDLERRMLEAESKLLKSQLNPHFLFNALNNLYALAHAQSTKTAEYIHKLSKLLSYVLYECDSNRVQLGKEIEYLKSFVEFQLLKDDQLDNVELDIGTINPHGKIAPLLLIPFIENCFKHSHFENTTENWIRIAIHTEGNTLFFEAVNSIPSKAHRKPELGGIGLENVQRRLDLMYPNRHLLNITSEEGKFHVTLKIELNEA